jgi:hypothetical protein
MMDSNKETNSQPPQAQASAPSTPVTSAMPQVGTTTRKRSVAWIYYAILACVGVMVGFQQPSAFLAAIACGAYSRYIYRGGRIVIWFW